MPSTSERSGSAHFELLIIGGGAAGTLVAIHALEAGVAPSRIALVERRTQPGQGIAYSTPYDEHVLNVIASRMSVFEERPGDFVEHLAKQGMSGAGGVPLHGRFVPRACFGEYLQATLRTLSRGEEVAYFHDEAVALSLDDGFSVLLRSGTTVRTRNVVLAVGNFPRALPMANATTDAIDAWNYEAVRAIDPAADVCIVGSGLSMVDALASLAATGHRGAVTVISRHGLAPLPHASPGRQGREVAELLALGVRERLRAIRARAAHEVEAGRPWQWTFDALRHAVPALWQSLSVVEQRRFLRHAARFWDIHRHRIAPAAGELLARWARSGQLRIIAGRLVSIARDGDVRQVVFHPRHGAGEDMLQVHQVINATGMESRLTHVAHPLLRSLMREGLVAPGPHGIGLATAVDGTILNAKGEEVAGFYTLGAARVGSLWESIAIPELRVQAQQIAVAVVAGDGR